MTPRWRELAAKPSFWLLSTMRAVVDSACCVAGGDWGQSGGR